MNSRIKLIRDYFELSGGEAVREIKALSDLDKAQLGSAIARDLNLDSAVCDFELIDY